MKTYHLVTAGKLITSVEGTHLDAVAVAQAESLKHTPGNQMGLGDKTGRIVSVWSGQFSPTYPHGVVKHGSYLCGTSKW